MDTFLMIILKKLKNVKIKDVLVVIWRMYVLLVKKNIILYIINKILKLLLLNVNLVKSKIVIFVLYEKWMLKNKK